MQSVASDPCRGSDRDAGSARAKEGSGESNRGTRCNPARRKGTRAVVALSILLPLGCLALIVLAFAPSATPVRLVEATLTAVIPLLMTLAVRAWDLKRQTISRVARLRDAAAQFQRWLPAAKRQYEKERSQISADHEKRHVLPSSMHACKVAAAFVDYHYRVNERWFSRVDGPTAAVLAEVALKEAGQLGNDLAELYEQSQDSMRKHLRDAYDETMRRFSQFGDLDKVFESSVRELAGDELGF